MKGFYTMLVFGMFEKELGEFITSHINTVLSRLKKTNEEYRNLTEQRTQHSVNISAITCNDNTMLNELIQNYISCTHEIQDIEQNTLYLQGIKDTISMLKYIGFYNETGRSSDLNI